jgi:hypothetical protein
MMTLEETKELADRVVAASRDSTELSDPLVVQLMGQAVLALTSIAFSFQAALVVNEAVAEPEADAPDPFARNSALFGRNDVDMPFTGT